MAETSQPVIRSFSQNDIMQPKTSAIECLNEHFAAKC